jgi:hypothetical protein
LQIDAGAISTYFDNFVSFLGLAQRYCIFVLNPDVLGGSYGYRTGLNDAELTFLAQAGSVQGEGREGNGMRQKESTHQEGSIAFLSSAVLC